MRPCFSDTFGGNEMGQRSQRGRRYDLKLTAACNSSSDNFRFSEQQIATHGAVNSNGIAPISIFEALTAGKLKGLKVRTALCLETQHSGFYEKRCVVQRAPRALSLSLQLAHPSTHFPTHKIHSFSHRLLSHHVSGVTQGRDSARRKHAAWKGGRNPSR